MSPDPSRDIRTGGGWYNEGGQVYNTHGNQHYGPRNQYGAQAHGNQVRGSQFVGSPVNVNGGSFVGGDHIGDDRPYYHTLNPVGRLLMALGSLAALGGFALFAYVIYRALSGVSAQMSAGAAVPKPSFDLASMGLGFVILVAGIALIGIGSAVGRSARRR